MRAFKARCHTHSYVGGRSVRREILCMHKKILRMHADVGRYKMCQFHDERSACLKRVLNVPTPYGLRVFSVRLPYINR